MSKSDNTPEPVHHLSLRNYPLVSQMSQEQLQEFMSKLKAASRTPVEPRRFPTYTIVVDLGSDARSLVYAVDPELTVQVGDDAAVMEFKRFARRSFSKDVYEIRLIKYLETPDEECMANAERTKGFAVVMNPEANSN